LTGSLTCLGTLLTFHSIQNRGETNALIYNNRVWSYPFHPIPNITYYMLVWVITITITLSLYLYMCQQLVKQKQQQQHWQTTHTDVCIERMNEKMSLMVTFCISINAINFDSQRPHDTCSRKARNITCVRSSVEKIMIIMKWWSWWRGGDRRQPNSSDKVVFHNFRKTVLWAFACGGHVQKTLILS